MAVQIQFRRGLAAAWTSANPILAEGELGLEMDTLLEKMGNGVDAWNDLAYKATGGGVWGSIAGTLNSQTDLADALDLKAPLADPALTGTPTAPTAAAATNTTQIATTAFVRTEVANLVAAAPGALDTLDELAAALGDDPNFAASVATSLGTKEVAANKNASGGYTGLTAFKVNVFNALGTVTSWFTSLATTARTYTLPDKDGTVAMTSDITAAAVGLSAVTNDAQTKAAVVPNTAPAAGQIAIGNAGNTAYAPQTVTGDIGLTSAGVATVTGHAGDVAGSDHLLTRTMFKDCGATYVDKGNSGTSTQTLDYTAGSHQKVTCTGNFTLAVSNLPPTGNLGAILLEAVNFGANTVTWPTASFVKPDGSYTSSVSTWLAAWTGRTAFQSSGTDWLKIWSRDASTLIIGWAA